MRKGARSRRGCLRAAEPPAGREPERPRPATTRPRPEQHGRRVAEQLEGEHERHDRADDEQPGPATSSGCRSPTVGRRHDPPRRDEQQGDADRHVDEEDPLPAEVLGEEAAEQRRDDGGDEGGPGQVGDRADQLGLVGAAQDDEAPDRHHHAPARPCTTRAAVSATRSGLSAQASEASVNSTTASEEHPPCAPPLGEPGAQRDERRDGDQVAGDRDAQLERAGRRSRRARRRWPSTGSWRRGSP